MIGQHPDLYGFPELKLFAYETVGELAASLPDQARHRGITHRSPGLVRALAELQFGGQTVQALAAASTWLGERPHWTGEAVFDLLMEHIHPRRAVEKSPEHTAEWGPLERLVRAYPAARFVHLTRHPVATVNSMHEHLRRNLPGYDGTSLVQYCLSSWLDANTRLIQLGRRLSPERILRVRAEDVLNEPLPQLARLAGWLGIRTDEEAIGAMMHPEQSPYARYAPSESGVSGGNDPSFLADPRPHAVPLPCYLQPPNWWTLSSRQRYAVHEACDTLGYR